MDKAHIVENFGAKFSYAYYIRMKKNPDNHYLSIGVAAGFKMQNIRFDEATINHEDDPSIFYNGVRKTIFDADAGINYYVKGLNIGAGVSNLAPLSYNYESTTNSLNYKSIYHLYGNVSYDIMMGQNKNMSLKPGVLVRYVPNIPIQFDGSLLFDYKNIFWVGGGYRYKNVGVFGMAGVRLFDMVSVGYAYEQSIDGNQGALGSTHEFNVGLRFKAKGNKQEKAIEDFKDDYADKFNAKLDSMKQAQKDLEARNQQMAEELAKQRVEDQNLQNQINNKTTEKEIIFSDDYINNFDLEGQVQFEKNASNLYPSHKQQLDGIYNQLKPLIDGQKLVMVHLVGSASVEGDEDYNLILSNKRVENVRQYLIEKGVPEKLISSTFKGSSEGVVKNNIEDFTKDKVTEDMINTDDRTVKVYMLTK